MLNTLDYDPNNPIPVMENKALERYLSLEVSFMTDEGYLINRAMQVWRERAVIVIFKYSKSDNFDASIPFLAMNYFDRYISNKNPIPIVMNTRQHDLELLAICCLTLAWKMRSIDFAVPKFLEERPDLKVVTRQQILAMELHILKALDWHMRPITALCFVRHFEPKFNSTYGIRRRTINQIIIQSQEDILITNFQPSVVAASALLAASSFLYSAELPSLVNKINAQIIFQSLDGHISLCMTTMINLCTELKLMIESVVAENEYIPKIKVQAGNTSQQATETFKKATEPSGQASGSKDMAAEPSGQAEAPGEKSEQAAAEESKQVAAETTDKSMQVTATTIDKSKQVAVEKSAEGAATVKFTQRPGKEKVQEMEMTPLPKMEVDSEETQFGFPLKWRIGENNEDDFAIFSSLFELAAEGRVSPRVNPAPRLGQDEAHKCCGSNCCSPL